MFGFLIRRLKRDLVRNMEKYLIVIEVSVYHKLKPSLTEQYGEEQGAHLAAAVMNRLFGNASTHSEGEVALVEQLAADVVRNDGEVRYAAVMSLQTIIGINELRSDPFDPLVMWRVIETVQWMAQFGVLPPVAAEPRIMKQLAETLSTKYISRREQKNGGALELDQRPGKTNQELRN